MKRYLLTATLMTAACGAPRPQAVSPQPIDAQALLSTFAQRYVASAESLDVARGQPRSTLPSGAWHVTAVNEWTSGFFPGTLWYLYHATSDERLRVQAQRWTLPLADIPLGTFSHDLGFQYNSSFINGYRFTGEERFRAPALNGARLLANRFNARVGAIKSWDFMPASRPFPVIVDNMMNLELLFWGARQPDGDPRWKDMAIQHARTTLRHHVRADNSSFHVVVFDPATGGVREKFTHQGHADSTTWARGQAWLIYGFTMVYRETGEPEFLDAAQRIADYFIVHLPADALPCWDFQAPGCPATAKRDASAAAIAASGLFELTTYVHGDAASRYRSTAQRLLRALSAAPQLARDGESAALLPHAVGHHPAGTEVDVGLVYADYYYVEALLRASGQLMPARTPRVFTARSEWMRASKEALRADNPALVRLIHEADSALTVGPFTVTSKTRVPPSGDKRDYVSYGPYWWPDSTRPNGLPYVRRDGEVNWDLRRESDALRWYAMVDAVETLAHAYYFTDKDVYGARAALLLRTWFVNPETRMNPHLRYGQAIPGVTEGRGIGIIDTRDLGRLTDAISLVRSSRAWTDADDAALQTWMRSYLDWLVNSEHGKDEADELNNHGTWYDVQVVALALFTGDTALARRTAESSRAQRIAAQIDSAGRQPLELARTRSLHYSVENLEGMTRLAEMARAVNVDLWNWRDADSAGIADAVRFVAPFADTTRKWTGQQITAEAPDLFVPLLRRSRVALHDTAFNAYLRSIPAQVTDAHRTVLFYPELPNRTNCDVNCRVVGQVVLNGRRTGWLRDYATLDTDVTAMGLQELTQVPRPDARTRAAIRGAATWLRESALHGLAPEARWARQYRIDGIALSKTDLTETPAAALRAYDAWLDRVGFHPVPADLRISAVVDARYGGRDGDLQDGVAHYRTIARALQRAPATGTRAHTIYIKNGRYREKLSVEKPNIHFIGESRDSTVLTFDAAAGHASPTGGTYGTRGSATLRVGAPGFRLRNMTVENSFDYMANYARPATDSTKLVGSQGVAVMLDNGSDYAVFQDCRIDGHQDTLFPDAGRSYFHKCRISGSVDFIFGAGRAVFDSVTIVSRDRGSSNNGYITAPSTPSAQPFGFLIVNSRLEKETPAMNAASVTLGRPWRPGSDPNVNAHAVFINTWMDDHIGAKGWDFMNSTDAAGVRTRNEPADARFFEFNSNGPGAIVSLTRRVLKSDEATRYTIRNVLADWSPQR